MVSDFKDSEVKIPGVIYFLHTKCGIWENSGSALLSSDCLSVRLIPWCDT